MTELEIAKEDLNEEEQIKFETELRKNLPADQQIQQPSRKNRDSKQENKDTDNIARLPLETQIVKTQRGVQPVTESDETHRNLKILNDEEQAAIRKRNLDRKTSYYHSESMKKRHVIPIRLSVNYETNEETWQEKSFEWYDLTMEEEDKLQELRATMDDLEKQTWLFNRQRAIMDDKEYNVVKRKWHLAKRSWAVYASKVFLRMSDEDFNRSKSTTLINVLEACEYRSAITVPY